MRPILVSIVHAKVLSLSRAYHIDLLFSVLKRCILVKMVKMNKIFRRSLSLTYDGETGVPKVFHFAFMSSELDFSNRDQDI